MFDFDGVVADSLEIFYTEFSAAVRELGYTRLDSREALLRLFEGNVIANLVKAGFPIWRLRSLGKQFAPRIAEANKRVEAFEGMPELVAQVAERFPVYVVTSNTTDAVEGFLARYGVAGVLEVLGADKEASKVKKIKALRKRHPDLAPWFVGDTKGDMLEANAAGAVSVAAAWGWHSEATLLAARPKHLVHRPEDLRRLLLDGVAEPELRA